MEAMCVPPFTPAGPLKFHAAKTIKSLPVGFMASWLTAALLLSMPDVAIAQ
jgi:hypothetical protein